MVYVTPTRDMAIRKSEEVEPGGRVGGSMLGMWERKWEVSIELRMTTKHLY
jgi:hypothetical protein